jgi:hypothetical protein
MASAIFSKVLSVGSGIILSTLAAHFCSLYISWFPEVDLLLFSLIVAINVAQLLV